LAGFLWSTIFVANPTGTVQERRVSGPTLIPQAQGAQIDSAALTPQSAPFLASADAETGSVQVAENVDVLYGEGALKDSEPVVKTKTAASTNNNAKKLASGVIYTSVAKDTLQSISAVFGVPIDTIVEFNPSVNFSALVPGISIVIPSQQDIASFSG
jgi:LysM repeat protein